jgi:hypothetical protein
MRCWTVLSAFKIKQHLLAVYIITFHFLYAIQNLENFIFVKTTSEQKNTKHGIKGIEAELGSPDRIAKRWTIAKRLLGDSSQTTIEQITSIQFM